MITVEVSIQQTSRSNSIGYSSAPETILSVAFVRDSLPEALDALKRHLELLDSENKEAPKRKIKDNPQA